MSPFEMLGLADDASASEVEARWRALRSELHPDKGGDGAQFDKAKKAYEAAHAIAAEPKACPACVAGKITVTRGFNQVKLPCTACGGSGVSS